MSGLLPFAKSELLRKKASPALKAPNGVGVDGMVITLAKVLAGAATNHYGNGYYQGDQSLALEASGAFTGAFGSGAYAGNPGKVLINKRTGASFSMIGYKRMKFLVPYMWNPATLSCQRQMKFACNMPTYGSKCRPTFTACFESDR